MQLSTASKAAAVLVALTGVVGLVLLAADAVLWRFMPLHAYGLICFVLVDFVLAGLVASKPSRTSFTVLAVWSILRILILLGDIGTSQMGPMAFADYLFNPAGVHPPNPAGVPGILIDIIVVLEILTIGISWAGRSSAPRKA